MELKKLISEGFKNGKLKGKTLNEIAPSLRLSPSYKNSIRSAIRQLTEDGEIIKDNSGRYYTPKQAGAFRARVKGNPQGYAFLIPEGYAEREHDYFVPKKRLKDALDGDLVVAIPVKGTADEAAVVSIAERGRKLIVGRLEVAGRTGYVIPDDRAFCTDVFVPYHLFNGANDGDKVVAEILSYPRGRAAGGKIVEILGEDGDFFTEEDAIIRSYNLHTEFPEYVEETAEKVAKEPVVLKGRLDLRELLTVTIDGADTRDIDDAVSLEKTEGGYRLGVHIADVSHYVKRGGCIDKEAYERGTSVYFPDRVLPMLPKALSNGACSLNEGENRYAMSLFMTFDESGEKTGAELCESVIKSDKKMTYDEVASILKTGGGADGEYPHIAPMLRDMQELCLLLEQRRKTAGEVALDVKEAHIYLNERDEIVIPEYRREISHRIIEQFMVSANESVAEIAERKNAPFLYRIHEKPAPEKAEILYGFLRDLGVNAKGDINDARPSDYQKILSAVADKPYSSVVNKIMLRSMQKARYSEVNKGHFGLASDCYCHFTSPIRRYPDLFIHRVLKDILHGELDKTRAKYTADAKTAATDTSERERLADAVERDVDDLYKLAYMSERIGEEYDAVISGVIESGVFAELANTVEGMIRLESLPADSYEYIPEKFLLKGARHSYRIGDAIRIKVAGCDFGTRRVQFTLA